MEHFYGLIVGILSVWRITHLLHAEGGPWDAFGRLRRLAEASNFWSSLFGCFYCMSIWVAAPCALLIEDAWKERLLLWPALSGGAILLERLTAPPPIAAYYEEEEGEKSDVRMQTTTTDTFTDHVDVTELRGAGQSGRANPRNN